MVYTCSVIVGIIFVALYSFNGQCRDFQSFNVYNIYWLKFKKNWNKDVNIYFAILDKHKLDNLICLVIKYYPKCFTLGWNSEIHVRMPCPKFILLHTAVPSSYIEGGNNLLKTKGIALWHKNNDWKHISSCLYQTRLDKIVSSA